MTRRFATAQFKPKTLSGRAFAVFVLAILLLVIVWVVALVVMERRLTAALMRAEIEFGLPNSIEGLLGPPVPPERNAAVPLDAATKIVQQVMRASAGRTTPSTVAERLRDKPKLVSQFEASELNALLDEADRRAEYASLLIASGAWFNLGGSPLIDRRDLHSVEAFFARRLAESGRANDAVRRLLRILRIGRKWTAHEPFASDFVGDLSRRIESVEVLNAVLRRSPLDADLYQAIDEEMSEQDGCHRTLVRLYHIEKLKRLDNFDASPSRQTAWWLVGPTAVNDRLLIVDWYDMLMGSAKRPLHEVKEELRVASDGLRAISKHPIDRLLHPDTGVTSPSTRQGCDWLQALSRCLRVVNAMAAQHRWEDDFDDLGLARESLVDPVNGERLRLKQTPMGPVIYSVGVDLRDDGGNLKGNNIDGLDIGLGPVKK